MPTQKTTKTAATKIARPRFPIKVDSGETNLSDGRRMRTKLEIGDRGVMTVTTTIWAQSVQGFHGATFVAVMDKGGNLLWATEGPTSVVDSKFHPFGQPSKKKKVWTAQIPKELVPQIARVAIINKRNPKGFMKTFKGILKDAKDAKAEVERVVKAYKGVIAVLALL